MAVSDGAKGYEPGSEEGVQRGSRAANAGRKPIFTNLPPRERAAIEQGQAEKYPEEYGPLVEQYLRNLANESGAKK